MLIKPFKFALLAVLFSLLFSCAASSDFESLDASLRSYERAIRWGEFTAAKSFHKNEPELKDLERRRLKFYRVTNYAVIRNEVVDKFNSHAYVEIKYYKSDRPVIKSVTVKQHWKRDKGSKLWYLESPFPKFR